MEYQVDNEKGFETWEEFLEEWERIKKFREQEKQKTGLYVSDLIYRGQANSDWKLKTTLERFTEENKYEVDEYYQKIYQASYPIEAFTKERWKLPTPSCYSSLVEKLTIFIPHKHLFPSRYDVAPYFLYLRHHGFPSPLLDWSRSPFLAAYFAFNEAHDESKYVSIYLFLELIGGKSGGGGKPTIDTLGSMVKSHERHFLQQCEYTFCLQEESGKKYFVSHHEAFSVKRVEQQYIWKCNILASERKCLPF